MAVIKSEMLGLPALESWYHSNPLQSAFIIIFSLALFYQLSIYIYNLYFHPLSHYPGPLLCRMSKAPLALAILRGKPHLFHAALHAKYGPVVRTEPNSLAFVSAQAWKDVHGFKKKNESHFPKDPISYSKPPNGVSALLGANDADHARFRRVFAHAFSEKALKEQEPLFRRYIDQLVRNLGSAAENGEKVDLVRQLNFTTFDIMGDLTFGAPLGLLDRSEYTPWVTLIFAALKAAAVLRTTKYYPWLSGLATLFIPRSLVKKRDMHFKFSSEQVDRRLEKKLERPDIWGLVLKQEGCERALSLPEMHSNAAVFMGAGTETTATELSGTIYYLLSNPTKLERLVKEIQGEFANEDEISMERLAQLPYLVACLEEGLRVYPPVPTGLPRVAPPEGGWVDGHFLPPGTRLSLPQYAAYHSTAHWFEPNTYAPERWLPSASEQNSPFANDDRAIHQPFSIGPRNCLGKNMAYHEMRLVLAKVLWHFDLELCEESKDWEKQRVFVLWEKKPLMLRLRRREWNGKA